MVVPFYLKGGERTLGWSDFLRKNLTLFYCMTPIPFFTLNCCILEPLLKDKNEEKLEENWFILLTNSKTVLPIFIFFLSNFLFSECFFENENARVRSQFRRACKIELLKIYS